MQVLLQVAHDVLECGLYVAADQSSTKCWSTVGSQGWKHVIHWLRHIREELRFGREGS